MKILFVAPSNSVHTTRWLERAQESKIEVLLYDLAHGSMASPLENIARYEVIRLTLRLGFLTDSLEILLNYRKLRRILKEESPDLVHLHWLFHGTQVAAALTLKFVEMAAVVIS